MELTHPYGGQDPSRLAELARAQHGVVANRQLRKLGFSQRRIDRRIDRAEFLPVHRGVYAVGHTRLTPKGHFMAAVLACGPKAVLSHHAAAAMHDLRRYPTGTIDVTARGKRAHAGVRCHITAQPPDSTKIDGIPVTTLARTFLDLAEVCAPQRLRSHLEEAERRQILDAGDLKAVMHGSPGRHGLKPLAEAIASLTGAAPWLLSDLERDFRELLRAAGLPLPQTNVLIEGLLVDCVWPEQRLIVELDTPAYHDSPRAFESDRRRDMTLLAAGWRVVRITGDRVRRDAPALITEIRLLLAG